MVLPSLPTGFWKCFRSLLTFSPISSSFWPFFGLFWGLFCDPERWVNLWLLTVGHHASLISRFGSRALANQSDGAVFRPHLNRLFFVQRRHVYVHTLETLLVTSQTALLRFACIGGTRGSSRPFCHFWSPYPSPEKFLSLSCIYDCMVEWYAKLWSRERMETQRLSFGIRASKHAEIGITCLFWPPLPRHPWIFRDTPIGLSTAVWVPTLFTEEKC